MTEINSLEYKGYVNLDSGMVLVIDTDSAGSWQGDADDKYHLACEWFRRGKNCLFSIDESSVIWDVDDAGACDIFQLEGRLILLCSWLEPDDSEGILREIAALKTETITGRQTLRVMGESISVVWAPINSEAIMDEMQAKGTVGVENIALALPLANGQYSTVSDYVEHKGRFARRMVITPT